MDSVPGTNIKAAACPTNRLAVRGPKPRSMSFSCIVRCPSTPTHPHEGLKTRKITKRLCEEPLKIVAEGSESHIYAMTIDSFPDIVLLEIFDFYRRDQDRRSLTVDY